MRTSKSTSLYSSVLCPVDFSEHAAHALRYAAAVVRRSGARLHVLFVNDPLLVAAAAAAYDRASLGEASRAELQQFVATTIGARRLAGMTLQLHTAIGKPAREVLNATDAGCHDLIVMGTKGLNGARRMLLGSTTVEVLRHARVPVLAVPPAPSGQPPSSPAAGWPGRSVVAAIEFGPHAADDVRRAADVARWSGAQLILTHIVPVPTLPGWLSADVDTHLRHSCGQAEAALDALRVEARKTSVITIVRVGHPPDQIAAIAADHRAGVIVMGLRGEAGLFGRHAGACAYQVLCHGTVPVLALPDIRRSVRRR